MSRFDRGFQGVFTKAMQFGFGGVAVSAPAPSTELSGAIVDLLAGQGRTGDPVTSWTSTDPLATIDADTFFSSPAAGAQGGVELDGAADYFNLSNDLTVFQAMTETGVFSLGCRLRIDDPTGAQECIIQTKGTGRGIFIGTNGAGGLRVRAFNNVNASLWTGDFNLASAGVVPGDTFDFAVIGDGVDVFVYIDGALVGTITFAAQAGGHEYRPFIGRYATVAGGYYDGEVISMVYADETHTLNAVRTRMGAI